MTTSSSGPQVPPTVDDVKVSARDELLRSLRQATLVQPVQAEDIGARGPKFRNDEHEPGAAPVRHWLETLTAESTPCRGSGGRGVETTTVSTDEASPLIRADVGWWEVLETRRSGVGDLPVNVGVLRAVMQALGTVRREHQDDVGRLWQSRVHPSAGGTHCLEPLLYVASAIGNSVVSASDPGARVDVHHGSTHVEDPGGLPVGWYRQQPGQGARDLERVRFDDEAKVIGALSAALHDLPSPSAVIFAVADPDLLGARYPGGSSLLWRDAGAFLMTGHLIATAYRTLSTIVGVCVELAADSRQGTPPFVVGAVAIGATDARRFNRAGQTNPRI